jgi:hypothetical protein
MPLIRCKICGKEFYAKPSWLKRGWGKYCSSKCQYKAQLKGKFVYCDICGKKIWRKPLQLKRSKSRKFFCSKSCQTLWRNREFKGPRHGNWKGGENIDHKKFLIQNGIKPICKLCGCKDERVLAVHHLDRDKKHNNIKNLAWLCHNCHHLVHCYNTKV